MPPTFVVPQIPLPFLPPSPPLSRLFGIGTLTLLAGLMCFNAPLWLPAARQALKAWMADDTLPGSGSLAIAPK